MVLPLVKRAGILLLAVLTLVLPAMAQDVSFTGQIAWRERILVPEQSTLLVTLVDMDTRSPLATARAYLGERAGSPVGFMLNVRSNVLTQNRQYGLTAEIWNRGRVIFASTEPMAVEPVNTDDLVLPVISVSEPVDDMADVEPPAVEPFDGLIDVVWRATSIGAVPVLPDAEVTMAIAADHSVTGRGSCNSYFAEASLDDNLIAFGPIAGTKMACDTAVMDQESRFFAALAATTGYELEGDILRLLDPAGVTLVGLVRQN